ncbi:2-dehydropantoate 2-reductase N-terminal domain-containing protein [Streptacidiphilus monticola]
MRITVLGAGAIGGFVGARLAAAGVETAAVARARPWTRCARTAGGCASRTAR